MNLIDAADSGLKRLRSSAAGEICWLLLLGAMFGMHVAALVPAFLRPELIDFSAFVDNARAWLAGTPYPETSRDPNVPHAILAFVPFVALPLPTALAIWTLLTYLCLWLTLRTVSRELNLRMNPPLQLTCVAVALSAPPSRDVFVNGNMIWPLALAFTWAWRLARHDQQLASAAVLGLLATIKPFLGMFGLSYLRRRQWRALGAMACASLATLTLAVFVTGTDAFAAWMQAAARITWYDVRFNSSLLGFFARVWRAEPVTWVAAAVCVATISYAALKSQVAQLSREWLFLFLAALLAAPLGWRYYLCMVVGPLLATLLSLPARGALVALLCLLIVSPAVPLATSSPVWLVTVGSIPMWTALTAWAMLAITSSGTVEGEHSP